MKLFYKNKILISGIFPMENFKIDGYVQKSGLYSDNMIDFDDMESVFYFPNHLIHSLYSCSEKNEKYFEYFENENLFEYEADDNASKNDIEKLFLKEQLDKINMLERKLRLLTGLGITLPIFRTIIYDDNNKIYTYVGYAKRKSITLSVRDYEENMIKKLNNRLRLYISDETINELETKNIRFKRALNFYDKSFDSLDIGIRFTLLFSALESLFNLTGEDITDEISCYASKILFLSKKRMKSSKWKIIEYYEIRSRYIHGNDGFELTNEIEKNLREYVREILIIYWNISVVYGITDSQDIKNLLDNVNNENLDLQVQLFIKYFRTEPSKFSSLYKQIRADFLNENYKILTNKNLDII